MTSFKFIGSSLIWMWVLYFLGIGEIEWVVGFTASFFIMSALGMFNPKKVEPESNEEADNERLAAFRQKFKEGQRSDSESEFKVVMVDEQGDECGFIIKESGEIETHGKPNPIIVAAANELRASIKLFGAEAVANELKKIVAATKQQKK